MVALLLAFSIAIVVAVIILGIFWVAHTLQEKLKKGWKIIPPRDRNIVKDPLDLTLTDQSTTWKHHSSRTLTCSKCKKEVSHEEFMTDTCNDCGLVRIHVRHEKTNTRHIWDGVRWKLQTRKSQ
jgi:hypothetical protein